MNAFRFKSGNATRRMDLLPPDPPARASRAMPLPHPVDVIDAEFEIVPVGARRGAYPVFNENRRPYGATGASPGKPAASRAATVLRLGLAGLERLLHMVSPKAFGVSVACICAGVFLVLVGLSHSGADAAPSPALAIGNVTATLNDADGMKVLSVYGAVENRSDAPKAVPAILVDVIAGGHKRTVSQILPGNVILAPGESRSFSTRLSHAGGKPPEVTVSFRQTGDSAP